MSPTTRLSMCRSGGRSLITPQSARAPSAAKGAHPGNHVSANCPEGAEHLFQCAVIAMPLRNQSMHNGGSGTQVARHQVTGRDGRDGSASLLSSQAVPSFRLGEAAGQTTDVTGADQLADGQVTGRRHGPVIAGGAAAPDPPLRVLAPEPVKLAILVVPTVAGGHGGRWQAAALRAAGRWGLAAWAIRLPPSRRDL